MRLVELRKWIGQRRGGGSAPDDAAPDDAAPDDTAHGDAVDAPFLESPLPAPAPIRTSAKAPAVRAAADAAWSCDRVALLDQLCGEGHVLPGGDAEIIRLAAPLDLSAAASVLLLGAGLGGPSRVLAGDLGASVTGYEADPAMVKIATARQQKLGKELAKRVTVERLNAAAPVFRAHGFHHAIALDPIRDGSPDELLSALTQALKPGGQLVLVQLTAETPLDPVDPAIARWCALERRPPTLPTAAQITRVLGDLGFDVCAAEDISSRHIRLTVQGWKAVVRDLGGVRPPVPEGAILAAEAELAMCRLRLLHAGRLRLMRWHGIGPVAATMPTGVNPAGS